MLDRPVLSGPSSVARTHLFENMPAGTLDMAGNEFGRLVGFSRLHVRDELAVLANDRGTPREREIETPAHGSEHFAVLPPKLSGMAVIVPLIHHGVEGGIQLAVPEHYSAELETGTTRGRVRFDFPLTVQGTIGQRITTTLGAGGAKVRAITTNGGVSIHRS